MQEDTTNIQFKFITLQNVEHLEGITNIMRQIVIWLLAYYFNKLLNITEKYKLKQFFNFGCIAVEKISISRRKD